AMLLLCSSRIMPPPLQPLILCFTHPPPTALYTLSLHDALPISPLGHPCAPGLALRARGERVRVLNLDARSAQDVEPARGFGVRRSEEHTSELQSHLNLVCRLLLEKKKKQTTETEKTRSKREAQG